MLGYSRRLARPTCVSAADPQAGWRWCKKCEGLWFADGGEARTGKCAADSGQYTLPHIG